MTFENDRRHDLGDTHILEESSFRSMLGSHSFGDDCQKKNNVGWKMNWRKSLSRQTLSKKGPFAIFLFHF